MKQRLAVSLLLAAALTASLGSVALAASQTWDLDSDSVMYKGVHSESGSVDIGKGGTNVWTAENATQVDVPFTAQTWNGTLRCQSTNPNKKFVVYVGIWNGSIFTACGTSVEYIFDVIDKTYQLDVSAFTVPTGQWLAFKVESTGNVAFTIVTDGSSNTTCPADDPAYPVPELPTIVLIATGLVILAGYFGFKRWKRDYIRAE